MSDDKLAYAIFIAVLAVLKNRRDRDIFAVADTIASDPEFSIEDSETGEPLEFNDEGIAVPKGPDAFAQLDTIRGAS